MTSDCTSGNAGVQVNEISLDEKVAGEMIRSFRRRERHTLAGLAESSGYSKSYLCGVETGAEPVTPNLLGAIHGPLNLSHDEWVVLYCRAAAEYLEATGWQENVKVSIF